jgi:hypothetical protein
MRVTSPSNSPIWLQVRSPKLVRNRFCARSQCGRDVSSFSRPERVRRRNRCRLSSPDCAPIHPCPINGLSMRVNVVVSKANALLKSPWVSSPVMSNAISSVYWVSSSPVDRSSRLYILVTARAARRKFAQAHASTGRVRWPSFAASVCTIHVYTGVPLVSSAFPSFRVPFEPVY